jgi:hypothetical protein
MLWPYGEAKTRYVAGLISHQRGETAQARTHFKAALIILQRLGERLYASVIQQALEQVVAHEPGTKKAYPHSAGQMCPTVNMEKLTTRKGHEKGQELDG